MRFKNPFAPKPEQPKKLSREQVQQVLDVISQEIQTHRDDAITARKDSGIEKVWLAAEEAYIGIDAQNRGDFAGQNWAKPMTLAGPVMTGPTANENNGRSTAFIPLTARYVDAGTAKVCEITLPADDKPFAFGPTPVTDLIEAQEDKRTVLMDDGQPAMRDPQPGEPVQQVPGMAPGVPIQVKDLAAEALEEATKKAKKAETRIYDWMVESNYRGEMRKVIFDSARIGVGVLKGPFPVERKARAITKDKATNSVTLAIKSEIKIGYKWVDPWNCYPGRSCGENIQSDDWFFEKDFLSPRQVRELKDQPGYIAQQIDNVIEQGPENDKTNTNPNDRNKRKSFIVWHFCGYMKAESLSFLMEHGNQGKPQTPGTAMVYVTGTMINDVVVKATFNPLEKSGEFPYHAMPWRRRPGSWAGVGVAEQVSVAQRIANGGERAMLNNAGKSAGSIIVMKEGAVVAADKSPVITPDKLYYLVDDGSGASDVRNVFGIHMIPNVTPQMLTIIEHAFKLAEESTSIPLITQGQSGTTTPETFGAAQLQNNNANQLLRSIGYNLDDFITEPVVRQSYEFLLLDPEVPDDEKGDWEIDAHGSSALVERAILDQTLAQLTALVVNPAYGVNPKKWFAELLKSKHMDPKDVQFTEEEIAKAQQTPPPPPPQVAVAQINAQKDLQIAQMREQGAMARDATDTDRDRVYVQAETDRTAKEHEARMSELALKRELALLDYANKNQMKLEDVKAKLADTTIKANLQRELAQMSNASQVMEPPTEPPGRAPDGQAYQK